MPKMTMLLAFALSCGKATAPPPTPTPTGIDCDTLSLDVPAGVAEIGGVWDEGRQRLVVFGGDQGQPVACQPQTDFTKQLWAFYPECQAFAKVDTEGGPKKRGRFAAGLDEVRGQMLVHGGRSRDGTSGQYTVYDDLWALDLATDTWREIKTGATKPPARSNHVLVPIGDKVVLYGGNSSNDGLVLAPMGDTWILDLTTERWEQVTPTGDIPVPRLFHAATTDGTSMYVYGGTDERGFFGPFLGQLYALDLDGPSPTWRLLDLGEPEPRFWASMVYDAGNDRLVMFGGHDNADLGNNNELWSFRLPSRGWKLVHQGDTLNGGRDGACGLPLDFANIDSTSPERRNAGMAVVAGTDLLLFGGKTDCGMINDVWALDLTTDAWRELSRATQGEACLRAYDDCTELCF